MAIPTNRASYQRTDNINTRERYLSGNDLKTCADISSQALFLAQSKTQSAYNLRLQRLRSLFKSLPR